MNDYGRDGRNLRVDLQPYLHSGEELLWVGQPYTTRKNRVNPVAWIFMLFWTGFAVFWTIMATSAGVFLAVFGLAFVGIGFYTLYAMGFKSKKQYADTVYAVTDRRAIILYPDNGGMGLAEYVFSNLSTVRLEEVEGDTGTIRFRDEMIYHSGYGYRRSRRGFSVATADITCAFYGIDDVHTVYRMISERMSHPIE